VNRSYLERSEQLKSLLTGIDTNIIKFVGYILSTHKEVKQYHDQFVQEGFEGLMARELNSKYEHARSNYLLKYKEFDDEEFKITSITTGVGSEAGAILFECITENGSHFTVRPRGTIENRKLMYEIKPEAYIGKQLTVRYQERDATTTIPRFPVGISVREYE
jgi:ATP-dependent DNA ligase